MLMHDGGNEQGLCSVLIKSVTTAAVLTRSKECWSAEREVAGAIPRTGTNTHGLKVIERKDTAD